MAASQTGYTLSKVSDSYTDWGNKAVVVFDVKPTASSYYTSGYLITPANVGLRTFEDVQIGSQNPPSGTPLTTIVFPYFDIDNNALQFFEVTATGTVAAPTINLLAGTSGAAPVETAGGALVNGTAGTALNGVTGVQAPAFTGTAATLKEVASASDMSPYVFRLRFIGTP